MGNRKRKFSDNDSIASTDEELAEEQRFNSLSLNFITIFIESMFFFSDGDEVSEESEEDYETAQEKRLRLAKKYLAEVEEKGNSTQIV